MRFVPFNKNLFTHYRIILPSFLVLFLTIGLFITVNQTQQNQNLHSHAAGLTNCTVSASQLTIKTQEQALLGEINQYRLQHSVGALIWNNTLKQSSAWLSNDMMTHNTLSHVDSLGRTPDVRLTNCGYSISNGYGESIAEGSAQAIDVFDTWKNDPAHNKILLDPSYTIAGIAMEQTSSGKAFWTMDFGSTTFHAPSPSPSSPSTSTAPYTSPTPSPSTAISASPSPSAPPSPSISPTSAPVTADMLISVSIKINGIGQGGNPHPKHLTRKVTAYVYGVGTQPVTTGTAYLSYDGSNYFTGTIHLGKLAQGPYFVKLVSQYTLQVLAKPAFQMLKVGQVNQIPPVTLYLGDMNGDNVLNIADYNLVLPCFQSKNCSTASTIDFNDDGTTDVRDYNLLLQSFEVLHGD